MRIAQIVLPRASSYERKSQFIDRAALSARHEVIETDFEGAAAARAAVAHVYGAAGFDPPPRRRFAVPYAATAAPRRRRIPWPAPALPGVLVSPLDNLPEAVDESFFRARGGSDSEAERQVVATFVGGRPGVASIVEQTLARIHRFREDVEWLCLTEPPSPEVLAGLAAWIDPAVGDDDYDGFVAEAVVAGLTVVASRTPLNAQRLEKGRTGFLVPPRDPNELTHAILTALFKPEVASVKSEAARQTAGKFRPRQRLRALERIYETLSR